jgi:hypothetical protein
MFHVLLVTVTSPNDSCVAYLRFSMSQPLSLLINNRALSDGGYLAAKGPCSLVQAADAADAAATISISCCITPGSEGYCSGIAGAVSGGNRFSSGHVSGAAVYKPSERAACNIPAPLLLYLGEFQPPLLG